MKCLTLAVAFVLITVGCSPKRDSPASQSSASVAADLGKAEEYFRNLYGVPKTEKQAAQFAFSVPGHGSLVPLTRPFVVQDFAKDRLQAKVVYSGTPRRAIWVKYTLPSSWTPDQINAALQSYGTDWKIVEENLGMNLFMRDKAPVVYRSSAGTLAYKTMVNALVVYAPQLYADLRGQIEEAERQKKAVPKF